MTKYWNRTIARALKVTIAMAMVMLLFSPADRAVAVSTGDKIIFDGPYCTLTQLKPEPDPEELTVEMDGLQIKIKKTIQNNLVVNSPGPIFDAPFCKLAQRKAADWAAEDEDVNAKLQALEAKFGKKPNIIYILTDDVGWGELGWQGGGKHRGTPSAVLDKMAYEGMRFSHAYSEPSCTPSRVAINTGRHPVRTGLLSVLWPGQTDGLSPDEVTLAEVLSQAGYDTAMWGKWHLGDLPQHAPENQGFDRSYYGLWNGAPDSWPPGAEFLEETTPPGSILPQAYDYPGNEKYEELTGIHLSPAAFKGIKGQGREPIDGLAGTLGDKRQEAFENISIQQMKAYIRNEAQGDKPFFIYWASYAQQLSGSADHKDDEYVDRANAQASFMALHNDHIGQLLDTLKDEGIAENTLVVWWSDNGPMYGFWPDAGYTLLQGAKGDVLEGGVRVPAMAWWPGMIAPNQDPIDFIHLTDLYTTAARIGGALEYIPSDRVTDGVDQTALLLLGEKHSHRNYMFHYNGSEVGAIRYEDFKFFPTGSGSGGLPEVEVYNVMRDPGERYGELYPYLWTVTPIQNMLNAHLKLIEKYPHRDPENPIAVKPATQLISPHD